MQTIFFNDVKSPIYAGMKFSNGKTTENKIKIVGFDIIRIYYDNSFKDCVVGQVRIKRVFK